MTKLILIRHGETNKNKNDVMHDYTDQEGLNENGKKQIQQTAKKLIQYSPTIVYSSKEIRSIESAKIISETLNIPTEVLNGMEERNWGEFSGKSWSEVEKILDPMSLEERYNFKPVGGESWKEFEERLINSVEKIVKANPTRTIAVVTHGGAIRALIPYLLDKPKEESFKYDIENGEIAVFDLIKVQ